MVFESQPLVRVSAHADHELDSEAYPRSIPAVDQLLREGIEFGPGATFLVGENGSGKSTLVEAIAIAYGLSPEGGTPHGHHSSNPTESSLAGELQLQRGLGSPKGGFFLRAETMHGWFSFLEEISPGRHEDYHMMSHGESFNATLAWATNPRFPGLLIMDEPEAALSFTSSLRLLRTMDEAIKNGSQIICATHSPVLASLPGATIMETGDWGWRASTWEDLELVEQWRRYLAAPDRYLRHLLD